MSIFGGGGGFDDFGGNGASIQTFSSSMGGLSGGMNVRSSSSSTKFVNGKKITTKRYDDQSGRRFLFKRYSNRNRLKSFFR